MMVLELLEYYHLNVDGTQTQYSSTTVFECCSTRTLYRLAVFNVDRTRNRYLSTTILNVVVLELGT